MSQLRPPSGPPVHPAVAAHPHPEPRPYAHMLRTWTYAGWKPLVGILLLVAGGFLAAPLLLLPVLAVGVAIEGGAGSYLERLDAATSLKSVTPAAMLYLNLILASLTLLVWALVRWLHNLRPRWATSVRPGMRWRFFFGCLGLAVIAMAASFAVGALLPSDPNDVSGHPHAFTGRLVALALVIVLTTPLQAVGEEYAFRGYLTMGFTALWRSLFGVMSLKDRTADRAGTLLGMVLSSSLFAFAHGAQNFPLFFDRFAFGFIAAIIAVRVGGLEAGMALHILNNLFAFGIAIVFSNVDSALNSTSASWWQLPLTVVQNGVYLGLVLLLAHRMKLRRQTAPPTAEELASQAA